MAYLVISAHPRSLTHRNLAPREWPDGSNCFHDNGKEETSAPAKVAGSTEASGAQQQPLEAAPRCAPSRWRWTIAFVVIAVLLVVFSLIVYWGLVQSVWWY